MNKKAIAPLWIVLIVIAILGTGATILEVNNVIDIIPNKYISIEPTDINEYMPKIGELSNFGSEGCKFVNEMLVCGGGATPDNPFDMIAIGLSDDCRQEVLDSELYYNGRQYKNVMVYRERAYQTNDDGTHELICSFDNKKVIQIGNVLGQSIKASSYNFYYKEPSVTNQYIDTYYKKQGI